jgi:hypothetical protein
MSDCVAEDGMPVANPGEAERRLWAAAGRGLLVDLRVGDPEADDPAHGESWGESRRVRAEVVAALLLGQVDPVPGCVPSVRLAGALVEGRVDVRNGVVGCPVELTDCRFADGLMLASARTRTIDLSGSVLEDFDSTAADIGGHMVLDRCHAESTSLEFAHIAGRLSLDGAHLANSHGNALNADLLVVDGGMSCTDKFRAEGEVRLVGAHIRGTVSLDGAHLANSDGDALNADGMTVDGDMFCEKLQAEGTVRLVGAHITGQLLLGDAHLANSGGDALAADDVTVDGGLFCEKLQAEGTVRLAGAHIKNNLWLNGAHLTNPLGNALNAQAITVDNSMFCQEDFRAEGTVYLLGAHITGQLGFLGATLSSTSGQALNCETLQAESLWLSTTSITGTVALNSARVSVLHGQASSWHAEMFIDGFVYDNLEPYALARGVSGRLSWLAHAETGYRPQPYEQLATYYRRLGHDEEARWVLLAKQRRRRAGLGLFGKVFGYTFDAIVGYGYRPARAFTWLVLLLAAGSVYFTMNRPAALDPTQHPHYQPVLYAADLLIPLANLGQSDLWAPAGAAQWVAAALVALGWILATAVVAWITRALTRT